MTGILAIVIQLVCGALGGNAAGGLMKNLSLGTVLNSVVGILGGGLGGQLIGMLGSGTPSGDLSLGGIIGRVLRGEPEAVYCLRLSALSRKLSANRLLIHLLTCSSCLIFFCQTIYTLDI